MKVTATFIVMVKGKLQVLYAMENGSFYITSNGAFGQRETYLEQMAKDDAIKLMDGYTSLQ